MKNIYVRKIVEYDPTNNGKYSKYEGYRQIAQNQFDPHISHHGQINLTDSVDCVYHSSHQRGIDTAGRYMRSHSTQTVIKTSLVNEISFDISDLCTEDEFYEKGSTVVRKRFISAFENDVLGEKRQEIKERIDSFFHNKVYTTSSENILVISHSFFMRLAEIYLITDNRLFEMPELLEKYFDISHKTYEFGAGFEFKM